MNDNLVNLEISIDASQFVGLEAVARERGGQSVSQLLSSFLPNWVSAIPTPTNGTANGTSKRRVM